MKVTIEISEETRDKLSDTLNLRPIYDEYYEVDEDSFSYAIEKLQCYENLESELEEIYGECEGLLETVVKFLTKHNGNDIGSPGKAKLLTDEDVDKWLQYKEAGTVEECREAMEKITPKNQLM